MATGKMALASRLGLLFLATIGLVAAAALPEVTPRLVAGGQLALDAPSLLLFTVLAATAVASALMAAASAGPALLAPFGLAALAGGVWTLAASSLDLASSAVLWGAGWILAAVAIGRSGGAERLEAASKVQGLGAAATIVLVLSAALVGGLAGTTHLLEAGILLAARPDSHVLALASIRVLVVGAALAAAWVPFHFWAPDGLGASPRPVALLLAVAAPLAASLTLARALEAFEPTLALLQVNWRGGLFAFAALTAGVGGSVALVQRDAARLTAYLTVVQCADLLPALVGGSGGGGLWMRSAVAHLLALAPAWLALAAWTEASGESTDFGELAGRGRRAPLRAILWIAALALAAGFPGGVRFAMRPEAAHATATPWMWALLLAASTLLQWAAVVRLARVLFLEDTPEWTRGTPPAGRGARAWPAWILVAAALGLELWIAFFSWRTLLPEVPGFGLLPGG